MEEMKQKWTDMLTEFQEQARLTDGSLLVIGCSTSEAAGSRIGTAGSGDWAELIYGGLNRFKEKGTAETMGSLNRSAVSASMTSALFKCSQHWKARCTPVFSLNRLSPPYIKAGGAMASYAYRQMRSPVLAESIQADAGIDIGDTFIGMHLKPVAVPVRISSRELGETHLPVCIRGHRSARFRDGDGWNNGEPEPLGRFRFNDKCPV
jgi:uncharacterized protein (TIGR01440 family)